MRWGKSDGMSSQGFRGISWSNLGSESGVKSPEWREEWVVVVIDAVDSEVVVCMFLLPLSAQATAGRHRAAAPLRTVPWPTLSKGRNGAGRRCHCCTRTEETLE